MTKSIHPSIKYRALLALLATALILGSCIREKSPTGPTQFQRGLTLQSELSLGSRTSLEVWGYFDEDSGKEYALVGHQPGVSVVDVSNPANPVLAAFIDNVPGFDIKVWQNYLYCVDGNSIGSGSIVDLSDPLNPVVAGNFPTAHNIFITSDGYLVSEFLNIRVYSLADPLHPQLIWVGGSEGHDAAVVGNRLYDFHGGLNDIGRVTNIYDFTDPANPQLLTAISDPSIAYHHSGWPSKDGRALFICNELAGLNGVDISTYDISDTGNPQRIGSWSDPTATVHNLYVIGDYAYASYYTAGFRVFDVSDPANIEPVATYDTNMLAGTNLGGCFGVYAFAPSGNIYVSDTQSGLFVFTFVP